MHPFHRKHNGNSSLNSRYAYAGKQNGIKRDENGEPSYEFDDKFYYEQKEPQLYSEKEASTLTEKENVLKSFILGKSPSTTSELSPDSAPISPDVVSEAENTSSTLSTNNKRTLNTNRSTSPSTPSKSLKNCVKLCISDKQQSKANETVSFNIPNIIFSAQDVTIDENNYDSLSSDNLSEPNKEMVSEAELVIQDVNQPEEKCSDIFESYSTGPLIDDMSHLKKILLANNKTISKKWLGEAFSFSKFPSYGMIQTKEGCSGIIASVNAYLVKELLFNETKNDVEYLRPNQSQLESALVKALTEILWQAGEKSATIAMLQNKKEIDTMENIIDMSLKKTFSSKGDLQEAIMGNISQFTQTDGHGCILFLISTILSRGVENVIDDMNGISSLISSNGFSTLELVNLLLTGRAVSNVFDNNIKLKYSTIKGIAKRSEIGYLSIKEHFKCCKVGSYLKTPRFPVWVVHNENHFTILFSCQKQLISDWKVERKFILYYYDSLKNLGDEIKLVIDTTQSENSKNDQDILKTSIEHCIRTKWKDANIKWK